MPVAPNSVSQILVLFTLVVVLLDVIEVGTVVLLLLLLVVEPTVLLLVEPTVLLDDELVGSGAVGLCESPHVTTTSPANMASSANAMKENLGDRGVRADSARSAAILCESPSNSRNRDSNPPMIRGSRRPPAQRASCSTVGTHATIRALRLLATPSVRWSSPRLYSLTSSDGLRRRTASATS